MILFLKILTLVLVILTAFVQPINVSAQNSDSDLVFNYKFPPLTSSLPYILKSYILLPADTKYSQKEIENQFKPGALNALRAAQKMYNDKLGGKTFKLNGEITVVRSSVNLGDWSPKTTLGTFNKLNGANLIPLENGVINVVWVVGSGKTLSGGAQIKQGSYHFGIAFMAEDVLLDSPPIAQSVYATLALTHEIGHALGLSHPCTQESVEHCPENFPQPLPSGDEWYGIMGYGGLYGGNIGLEDALNMNFNNSNQNPEVKILFENLFINPNKDPAPKPTLSKTENTKVYKLSSEIIEAGSELQIFGSGLKNTKSIEAVFAVFSSKVLPIKSLDNNQITVNIPQDIISPGSSGNIRIRLKLSSGRIITLPDTYKITRPGPPPKIITASYSTVCEDNDKQLPLPETPVRLNVGIVSTLTKQDTVKSVIGISDREGKGTISYTVTSLDGQYKIAWLTGGPVFPKRNQTFGSGTMPNQSTFDIIEENQHVIFVYPKCPDWVLQTENSNTKNEEKSTQPHLEEVVVEDGENQETVVNPEKSQEAVIEPSEDGPVSVTEIYDNGETKRYEAELDEGDSTKIGNIQITAKKVKRISKLVVNDEETALDNPNIDLENIIREVTLNDEDIVDGKYPVRIEVCFDNNEEDCIKTAYNFTLTEEITPKPTTISEPNPSSIIGKCGGDFGQVVVHIAEDGGETPDVDCTNQDQLCKEFTNGLNQQDAYCIDNIEQ